MPKRKSAEDSEPRDTIMFRFTGPESVLLAERAAQLGKSQNLLARQYLVEALQDADDHESLLQAVNALSQEVHALRKDLALTTAALLSSAGKISPEQAKTWVKTNLA